MFGLLILNACGDMNTVSANVAFIADFVEPDTITSEYAFIQKEAQFTDIRSLEFTPTLAKNGFSFVNFKEDPDKDFLDTLANVNHSLLRGEYNKPLVDQFNEAVEKTVSQWAKRNLPTLQFDNTICTLTVYRSNKPNGNAHMSYPIAHIDFAKTYYVHPAELVEALARSDLFAKKLGLQDADLSYWQDPKRLALLVNVWMPLNDVVKNHHLGVVDKESLNRQQDTNEFSTSIRDQENDQQSRRFYSVGLKYRSHHKWYFKSNMEFGEAIIFDTKNTAHASISPPEPDFERRSIETRCFFIKS